MPEQPNVVLICVDQWRADFLRRRDPRKPFFLFLSFHRPHPPYDPPAWALEQYVDQPLPDPPVGDWTDLFAAYADPSRPDCLAGDIDRRVLQRARAGYYGQMTHIDHQMNRFLETLHEFRQRDTTYICFVSDHGEMMGDHHLYRKGFPYEGSARVPLLLKGPRASGITPGRVCDAAVELRDMLPTLLDCAGLPLLDAIDGRSLLPLARGEAIPWRAHLHGEHTLLGQSLHWLTDGREKYVWFSGSGSEQLFDLEADPQERRDLARQPGHQARLTHWRNALIGEPAGREEGFTDGERLIAGRPVRACLGHLHG